MPETMAQTLARLQAANSDIGSAISAKGVTVPSGSGLEDYPSLISSIPSGSSAAKTVQFIDYDGTLLYEYTPDEFLALSSMPANYDHTSLGDGLGQGTWNHTYEGARYQVMSTGFALIGQTCELLVPQSAKDAINAIDSPYGNLVTCTIRMSVEDVSDFVVMYINKGQTRIYIDWGDGSSFDYKHYSTTSTVTDNITHTYSVKGNYVISVYTYNALYTTLYQDSSYYSPAYTSSYAKKIKRLYIDFNTFGPYDGKTSNAFVFRNFVNLEYLNIYISGSSSTTYFIPTFQTDEGTTYPSPNLKALVIPPYFYFSNSSNAYTLYCNHVGTVSFLLKDVPSTSTSIFTNSRFRATMNNSDVQNVIIPSSVYYINNSFNNCSSLKRVVFSNSYNGSNTFPYYNSNSAEIVDSLKDCSSLEEVYFTRITPTYNKQFYKISNNSFQNLPTTCKIYVPRCRYNDYITATAESGSGMPDPTVYEYIGY